MHPRLLLATLLALPLAGCGASSTPTAEISNEPLSDADLAAAQADMDRVADEERAYQEQNPTGPAAGKTTP